MTKKPISDDKGVVFQLKQVEVQAAQGKWDAASDSLARLETAWKKDKDRLTSPRTRNNVKAFEDSLEELKDEVRERDKKDVAEEIETMRKHYRNITSP